jgi:hypothetical protein
VTLDAAAAEAKDRADRIRQGERIPEPDQATVEQRAQRVRALRHTLAEYELKVHALTPGQSITEGLGA